MVSPQETGYGTIITMSTTVFDPIRYNNLQQELDRVVARLKQTYDPEKIIVYGSFVQKTTCRWSDIDIAIIKKTNKRFIDRLVEVGRLLDTKVATDVVVYTPAEFRDMARDNYFVRDEIVGKGRVMYDKTKSN